MTPKVSHYVLIHFNKEGQLVYNPNLIPLIRDDSFRIVVNNISNANPDQYKDVVNYIFGKDAFLFLDENSVSKARNKIIINALSTDDTHFTMIDGDDLISEDYHDVLTKFSRYVNTVGIFNGWWRDNKRELSIINEEDDHKYIKYAQHYTNWLYVYNTNFLSLTGISYPEVEGYSFPEDEYMFMSLYNILVDLPPIPVLNKILYYYDATSGSVAKLDSDIQSALVSYVCTSQRCLKYRKFVLLDGDVQELTKLTIVVPTIGRESLEATLSSLVSYNLNDYRIKVIVSIDRRYKDEDLQYIQAIISSIPRLDIRSIRKGIGGAGSTKQVGIEEVDTDFFMIIDDDDQLIPGALESILRKIDECDPNWLSYHWKADCTQITGDWISVDKDEYLKRYFDYDKYSKEDQERSIYPSSAIVYKSKVFKEMNKKGIFYEGFYADDTIPASYIMFNYPGYHFTGPMITYDDKAPDRLSKWMPTKFDLMPVVDKLTDLIIDTEDKSESRYWIKVLNNLYKRLNHVKCSFN